ncbi:trypsin-like serine protease [Tunturiibacter lichenicola]|uniref:trypsin-like serine protease n=1 Tax=Tunturiibacter lichenicola TaxID=2051959 RepID=UPI0021B1F86F|nr:trypsin-like serine protease [Edaphobacter lichenicola]
MPDYQQLVKVKEDAETRLRAIPGVHAVGISKKSVRGKSTDELAIAVFLVDKKPLERLSPEEVIPPEIDGFKTDVIQMQQPRLCMAADPNNLVATISDDQLTVTFSGAKDPPGSGIVIVVDYSSTDDSSNTTHYVAAYETDPPDTQEDIADALAGAIQGKANNHVTATSDDSTFTIDSGDDEHTCAITHCAVTAIDDKQYFDDHLRGGIQLQAGGAAGGFGTIGFLATTAATAQDPQGKVVAITCEHVVYSAAAGKTNLVGKVDDVNNIVEFSTKNSKPIPLNSLVEILLKDLSASIFYTTVAGDTPSGVATGVAAAVTHANIAGVSATNPGGGVRVEFSGLSEDETVRCYTFGPKKIDPDVDMTATVVGTAVTFTGEVSGDNYGIFTRVNQGGVKATCGVFTNPARGDTLTSIADAIAQAFTNLPDNVRGVVTASQAANTVTFHDAEAVSCVVVGDIQVGQPDNSFGSPCSHCCSHRIGHVIDSKVDVDIAVIQLDAGQKWTPEIEGFGLVSGIHSLTPESLNLPVFKRGRTLPVSTAGSIEALQVSGTATDSGDFARKYVNAIKIKSEAPDNGPFVLEGDSGSAIVDVGGAVVGVVFAGELCGLATPIDSINDAFSSLDLNLAPAPAAGQAPGDIRTVPKSAMAADEQKLASSSQPFIEKRLAEAEIDISATVEGSKYAELVKTHIAETQRLVNSNRRVATAWHRNGGPEILNAMLRMLQRHDEPMPESINGRPFADCLERMRQVFARYASPALAADLPRFAEWMKSFAGLTYPQMLATLRLRNGD